MVSEPSNCFRISRCIETSYLAGVHAMTVLIAAWELMFWVVRASRRAAGVTIPLVLAILTGWWAYGMVTLNFKEGCPCHQAGTSPGLRPS